MAGSPIAQLLRRPEVHIDMLAPLLKDSASRILRF